MRESIYPMMMSFMFPSSCLSKHAPFAMVVDQKSRNHFRDFFVTSTRIGRRFWIGGESKAVSAGIFFESSIATFVAGLDFIKCSGQLEAGREN